MSIKVRLYGRLKTKAPATDPTGQVGIAELDGSRVKSIADILEVLDLKPEETSHLFLNNDYSALERRVNDGDIVAIFPRDMALLYRWYFSRQA
ncbi:MAG: MoaD/ThiS family protein [Methanomassiliicoccales archaeon]|nr:MoaD/ThiS family protein [Methanomassiliicoccales archaeon]